MEVSPWKTMRLAQTNEEYGKRHTGAGGLRSASGHVYRLHRPRACITWSTRLWTTPSTRPWPATAIKSTCGFSRRYYHRGRGQRPRHPSGNPAKMGIPATVVGTVLHAGGKFGGGQARRPSRRGKPSVVNALHLAGGEVSDGAHIYQRFERKNHHRPEMIGTPQNRDEGYLQADPEIFSESTVYEYETPGNPSGAGVSNAGIHIELRTSGSENRVQKNFFTRAASPALWSSCIKEPGGHSSGYYPCKGRPHRWSAEAEVATV